MYKLFGMLANMLLFLYLQISQVCRSKYNSGTQEKLLEIQDQELHRWGAKAQHVACFRFLEQHEQVLDQTSGKLRSASTNTSVSGNIM